jgi:hypothetical protein
VTFRNRLVVLFEWARAYLTYQRSARIIISLERAPRCRPEEVTAPAARSEAAAPVDARVDEVDR